MYSKIFFFADPTSLAFEPVVVIWECKASDEQGGNEWFVECILPAIA